MKEGQKVSWPHARDYLICNPEEKDIEARSSKRKLLHVKADGQSADEREILR